jgi:16S rRNA (guanine527-N7)-methyltransferase
MEQALHDASTNLGLYISGEQESRLVSYVDLLSRWNGVYNLTALKDKDALFTHHVLDCLSVVTPLRRQLPSTEPIKVLDAGSGAGLPGVILAIMEPRLRVVCVDAVSKKTAFVSHVASELRVANLRAEHRRLEEINSCDSDVVTSRALSSLRDLVRLTGGALAPAGIWMAMKGKVPSQEISSVSEHAEVFHVEQIKVPYLQAERCLVWMRPLLPSHC